MKKLIRINCIAMAVFALMAFSCEPVDKDSVLDEDTEITPGNPDAGDDQPGEGQDPTPEPEPDPTPDPTPQPDPTPSEAYYVKVAQSYDDWSGDYLITYTDGSEVIVLNGFGDTKGSGKDISSSLTAQGIHSSTGDLYKATVAKDGSGYTINVTNVGYIGLESAKNALNAKAGSVSGDNKYQWSFSYKSGLWVSSVGNSGRRLQWNASASCFRCYTGGQEELTLYRRTTSTGGSTPSTPEPDPTPTPDPTPDPEPEPEPDPTPDPDPTPTPTPTPDPNDNCPYDWYELPTINYTKSGSYLIDSNDNNLYYAHHHCAGNEKGPGGNKARNYTVCYSAKYHCPVWVAAPRHKMYESGATRTDAYGKDPSIPSDIQYSSKNTGGGCNKGHMLGSAERLSSTATNRQVFYYTNIAPQYSDTFNTGGGAWNNLEDHVDGFVCSDTLYVVIGAYFDSYTDKRGTSANAKKISFGGRSDVSCPTMFYYVLLRTRSGKTSKSLSQCSSSELECVAMVVSHETAKGCKDFEGYMMPVSELEKITGFTYFANVPHAPKTTYNASFWKTKPEF